MDIIPTYYTHTLLIACPAVFSEIIARLVNVSFLESISPSLYKQASVTPVLKQATLDETVLSNYRPISNLNFISKILEHLF